MGASQGLLVIRTDFHYVSPRPLRYRGKREAREARQGGKQKSVMKESKKIMGEHSGRRGTWAWMAAVLVLAAGCAGNREIRDFSMDAPFLLKRGNGYLERGELNKAIVDYNLALVMDPSLEQGYVKRGEAYLRKKKYTRAIQDLERALILDPRSPEALFYRGQAYARKGRYEEALRDFNRAAEFQPANAELYRQRAVAYEETDRYESAIDDYDRAARLDPDNLDTYLRRGNAYFHGDRYDAAREDYERVLRKSPKHSEALFRKAVTCELSGRSAEALAAYRRFIGTASPMDGKRIRRAIGRVMKLEAAAGSF